MTKTEEIKSHKYKPVKFCMNCLRQTKKCTCGSRLVEIVDRCQNCGEMLMDDWPFCPICGFEIK